MEASQIMTRDVLVVAPELSLDRVWRIMERRRVRHLLVVSGGALLGIVSDRDVLVRASLADDGALVVPLVPVASAMTMQPITCDPDTSVSTLATTMIDRRLDAIPIVSEGAGIVGLVTSTDLLALLTERPTEERLPFHFDVRQASDA
ncbi:MAG: CBS domain-containing protein [Polyangiaceae bacterium]